MAELVMRKRPAMHAGEIGLFIDSPVFEEDFSHIKSGTDVSVKATQGRNLKQFRLGWALAARIAQSGVLGDADQREVMDYLLLKVKHVRYVTHKYPSGLEETIPVPKSIRWQALDGTAFNRIFSRMIYVITSEILPEMPEGELREKVEQMAGVQQEPAPEATKRRRNRPALPAPISVIPADEPVIGETPYSPALPASDGRPEDAGTDSNPKANRPLPSAQPASPPVPTPPEAGQAALPSDLQTWKTWATAWIIDFAGDPEKTDQDLLLRWNKELTLRNKCGVTASDRQPVFELYTKAVEEKRIKAKPI
jgi:hypothetical protein